MNLNIQQKSKNLNLGIEILRVLLSFWVVVHHCGSVKNKTIIKFAFSRAFHVPTFVVISFYFTYKIFLYKNINKLIERLERLYFPYIIWPIIIFVINNGFYYIFGLNTRIPIRKLIMQILIGRPYMYVLWYHFNIILITIFISIISFIFYNNFLYILQIIGLLSYILQYSDYNYNFFQKYSIFISHSVGLIPELYPIVVTGLSLSSIEIIHLLNKNRIKSISLSILSLYIIRKNIVFSLIKGNFYQGISLNICAIFLFIIFSQISFNCTKKNKNENFFIFIIKNFTRYTGGIYYLHIIIYIHMGKLLLLIKKKTIVGCIIIYLICYSICFIGTKLTKSTKLSYLFC